MKGDSKVIEKLKRGRGPRKNLSRTFLTPAKSEEEIGVSRKTLANWRHLCKGPDYIKIGGSIFYEKSALHAYVKSKVVKVEGE